MRFGRGTAAIPLAAALPSSAPCAGVAHLVLAGLAAAAALVAMFVWFEVIKVPLERPVGPLFDNPRTALREGWAPWHVAPPASFALSFALFWLYFRRAHRWTVLALALAGVIAVVLGSTVAYWVKNIGYTWYSVPDATALAIIGVQGPMFGMAFGRGVQALIQHAPLMFPTAALLGTALALWLDLPWRRQAAAAQQAGIVARIVTTALMTLFIATVAVVGLIISAAPLLPFIAATWWFVSFRHGRYDFGHLLLGSALHGVISTLPLALPFSMSPGFAAPQDQSIDLSALALGCMTRAPIYLLVGFVLIRITLVLSRGTDKALTAMPILRRAVARARAAAILQPASPARLPARLAAVAIVTLAIANDARTGMSGATAIVAVLVALTWWFVSFRDGGLDVRNMLAGSALLALIMVIAPLPLMGGPPLSILAAELCLRTAIYFVATFLMLRLIFALQKAVEKLRQRAA
jgi:hypothetical protein